MNVIKQVNNALKELLSSVSYLEDSNSEIPINFKSPANVVLTETLMLSVFLYQVQPNPYLRNSEIVLAKNNDAAQMARSVLIMDLYYLITPFATDETLELNAIEKVMRIINSNTYIEIPKQTIRIIFNPLALDDLNKLWMVFPEKSYKPCLAYILTPVIFYDSPINYITVKTREITYNYAACDLIFMPTFTEQTNYNSLVFSGNAAYIRTSDKLFYVNKQAKERILIPMPIERLQLFDTEMRIGDYTEDVPQRLSDEQLAMITTITGHTHRVNERENF